MGQETRDKSNKHSFPAIGTRRQGNALATSLQLNVPNSRTPQKATPNKKPTSRMSVSPNPWEGSIRKSARLMKSGMTSQNIGPIIKKILSHIYVFT